MAHTPRNFTRSLVLGLTRGDAGLTAVETAILFGISALILGLILVATGHVEERTNQERTVLAIKDVRERVRGYALALATIGSSGNAEITTELVANGVVPAYLLGGTTTPRHAWNGSLQFFGQLDVFTIRLNALPNSGCTELASRLSASFAEDGLTTVQIGNSGSGAVTVIYTQSGGQLPVRPNIAATACAASSSNFVSFTYTLRNE